METTASPSCPAGIGASKPAEPEDLQGDRRNGITDKVEEVEEVVEEVEDEVERESLPVEIVRHREAQWLRILSDWDGWMGARPSTIRDLCWLGVPDSLRARVWLFLTGARTRMQRNPGRFQELLSSQGDPRWFDAIDRDVHRQCPQHHMFRAAGGHGQTDLAQVLRAFSVLCPEIGYCQAQAPIAATLLKRMPAEEAFWCLVQICEVYLPGYYSPGLEAVHVDCELVSRLLQRRLGPATLRHLHNCCQPLPSLALPPWLMCAFARSLRAPSLARLWDVFFCQGVKILLRLSLGLLVATLEGIGGHDRNTEPDLYSILQALRTPPPHLSNPSPLIELMKSVSLSERTLRRCHLAVLRKRRHRDTEPGT